MSYEDLLKRLRLEGKSKIQSMLVLIETTDATIDEAKRIVHESTAWKDTKEQDDDFHDALEASAVKVFREM